MRSKIQISLIRSNIKKKLLTVMVINYCEFIKVFTSYLDEVFVYNLIDSTLEELKYCSNMRKNILTKTLK